jgi:hypothetical protein
MGHGKQKLAEYLLSPDARPEGFEYPPEFLALLERAIVDMEPWQVLGGETLERRFAGLKTRYPARNLVPFAARGDRDDVACWEVASRDVVVIHDFASDDGHLVRGRYNVFWDWLRQAVEDLIEHEGGGRRF